MGIYIILLFFPAGAAELTGLFIWLEVFQLFIQDGLVSREGGVNMGVLAAHVLQGQAGAQAEKPMEEDFMTKSTVRSEHASVYTSVPFAAIFGFHV